NAGSSGTTMRYQVDTTGGNSGSPVIDEATGEAVGVHTHGGCTTAGTGSNSGTSLFNTAFWAAVGEPPAGCEQGLTATLDDTTPAPGQTVTFAVTVTNDAASPATVDLWLEATGPVNRTIRFGSGTIPAGATVTRDVRLRIPGGAPSGSYTLDLNLGAFATLDVCDSVTFDVTLSAPRVAGGGTEFEALVPEGDLFAARAVTAAPVAVAPNPFSRQTQIRYEVTASADVRLAV